MSHCKILAGSGRYHSPATSDSVPVQLIHVYTALVNSSYNLAYQYKSAVKNPSVHIEDERATVRWRPTAVPPRFATRSRDDALTNPTHIRSRLYRACPCWSIPAPDGIDFWSSFFSNPAGRHSAMEYFRWFSASGHSSL